jgi:hypothetical protein
MADPILDLPAGESPVGVAMPMPAEPSLPSLLPGWRSVARAVIRVAGEEGSLDLVALHPERGVALIAFLDEGETASPEEAQSAFRAWLDDQGFRRLFPGELAIAALLVPRLASGAELAKRLDRAFAATPKPGVPVGWIDWLADHLVPSRAEKVTATLAAAREAEPAAAAPTPVLLLQAPSSEDATPPAQSDAGPLLTAADALPQSTPPRVRGWLDWGASLGFAFGMVAALVMGLLALRH